MSSIVLRPSGIQGFFDCSYRWFLDVYRPPEKSFKGIAAHIGSGVHKSAETYYKECIKAGRWLKPSDDFVATSLDYFRSLVENEGVAAEDEDKVFSSENIVVKKAKSYLHSAIELNKGLVPTHSEHTMEIPLKSNVVATIKGTIDIVGVNDKGQRIIKDIKTMNRLNNPSKYVTQLSIYAAMLEKSMPGEEVVDLEIHRVVTSRDYVDSVSALSDTKMSMSELKNRAFSLINTIIKVCEAYEQTHDESLFRGNQSSVICSSKYCSHFEECPYSIK